MPDYTIHTLTEGATIEDAHEVRRAVFIEEQDVPEALEMDGLENRATHFVIYDADDRPVATARYRMPRDVVAKPERVAVLESHRGEGLGRMLMDAIESSARKQGCTKAKLHAQTTVEAFYQKLGYETVSEEFTEAGIPHVKMEKELG